MKEIAEFRVPEEKAVKYLEQQDGVRLSSGVRKITVLLQDPLVSRIISLHHDLLTKGDYFYIYSDIHRLYEPREIVGAKVLRILISRVFEPTGEECGTSYSDQTACQYCGAGSEQVSALFLDPKSLPDPNRLSIAKTIGGEIVVSQSFHKLYSDNSMRGAEFRDIWHNKKTDVRIRGWYQLKIISNPLTITAPTRAGNTPFDDSLALTQLAPNIEEGESPGAWCDRHNRYACPLGHTIGLNLLSELTVKRQDEQFSWDLAVTRQLLGVRRGLLRPEPLLVASSRFRECVAKARLKGMSFEVVQLS